MGRTCRLESDSIAESGSESVSCSTLVMNSDMIMSRDCSIKAIHACTDGKLAANLAALAGFVTGTWYRYFQHETVML